MQSERIAFQSVWLGTIYIATNRSMSASVPLTAIVHAIQEIKVLCKRRHTNQSAAKAKSIVSMNILGTRLLSSPHWSKELRLPYLFVNSCRHSLSFSHTASKPMGPEFTKIKTVKISETWILPFCEKKMYLLQLPTVQYSLTSLVFFHSLSLTKISLPSVNHGVSQQTAFWYYN